MHDRIHQRWEPHRDASAAAEAHSPRSTLPAAAGGPLPESFSP
ncbi:MAG: hypothetical protein ACXVYV_01685 [Gaiellales bacterium]